MKRLSMLLLLLSLSCLCSRAVDAQAAFFLDVSITSEREAAPIVDLAIAFSEASEQLTGQCRTDDKGYCRMTLVGTATEDTVRGKLDFGAFGVRSLIFRMQDGEMAVNLQTNQFGRILVPGHDEHPTPGPWNPDSTPTALPPQQPQATLPGLPIATEQATFVATLAVPIDEPVSAEITPSPDSAETDTAQSPSLFPILLCSGLFLTLWIVALIWLWQQRRHPHV